MRKKFMILMSLMATLLLFGCSSRMLTNQSIVKESSTVVSEEENSEESSKDENTEEVNSEEINSEEDVSGEDNLGEENSAKEADSTVDLDLTTLGSNMVYAQVFNMVNQPTDFLGKSVKIAGTYAEEYYDVTDTTYHYVVISDAMACCQSGMEFICKDSAIKYPEEGNQIEIVGTYGTYEELDVTYYYVDVDRMTILP